VQNQTAARQASLTKPSGALVKLEDIAIGMVGWQRQKTPSITHGQCLVFTVNHGVVAQQISPLPAAVTAKMVDNAVNGGAAINQLCDVAGLKLAILPIDLDHPTADFTTGPAMDEQEVIAAMNKGAAVIDPACDYLVVGNIGIGNTTSAAALCLARFGADAAG
jgi:nicotinate-nucleotide--dimethylbenzimidazole phosphoribosyltransferase